MCKISIILFPPCTHSVFNLSYLHTVYIGNNLRWFKIQILPCAAFIVIIHFGPQTSFSILDCPAIEGTVDDIVILDVAWVRCTSWGFLQLKMLIYVCRNCLKHNQSSIINSQTYDNIFYHGLYCVPWFCILKIVDKIVSNSAMAELTLSRKSISSK